MSNKVEEIRAIRAETNNFWMDILQLALAHAPVSTKIALKKIKENDAKITALMSELVDE